VAGVIEQLERDPSNPAGQPLPRTVVISQGVDAAAPVVIEVVVDREGPVSLELLTKLLIVGVVFLATRHIAPSVAIVGAILSALIPDVVSSVVRRRRWGKKRVGILAALVNFFAVLDSAFGNAVGRRTRMSQRPGRGGARRALGVGHAAMTTAVAVSACAIAIAVPALASGGSPFPASHPATPVAATAPASSQAQAAGSNAASHPPSSHDRFLRVGLSPTGVPGSVTIAPEQRVDLEFTLTQPSHVVLALAAHTTLTDFNIWRDDSRDGSDSIAVDSTDPYAPVGVLAGGTHAITIESTAARAATLRYILYASTDLTQGAGVSAGGVPGSLTVTPGQRAHLRFTLQQPSHVVFALAAGSTLGGFNIWRDDNQDASNSIAVDSTDPYAPAELLPAGPHTITIEPIGASAGNLRFTLTAHPR
jgi:hypothetical protein